MAAAQSDGTLNGAVNAARAEPPASEATKIPITFVRIDNDTKAMTAMSSPESPNANKTTGSPMLPPLLGADVSPTADRMPLSSPPIAAPPYPNAMVAT